MSRKPAADEPDRLEEPEMIEILEEIARGGSDTARIQAIKVLLARREPAAAEDDWSVIYGDGASNVKPFRRAS